uniref:Glutathione S-transferase kappa 1 n=1 Tax=Engystomops pustulosus TaxID=76066 RepID=A0AAV6YZ14_ENGPU|nr:hypothetical protein GDO81_021609 [Engystomops pustulosus]
MSHRCTAHYITESNQSFCDILSPVLLRYKNIWNVDIHLRPGNLGAIMTKTGNSPPALVPKRGAYMGRDLRRLAKFYQVPVREPSDVFHVMLKKGSFSAMRFVTAVQMSHPEFVESVSRELWMRIWSEDKDITEPESLLEVRIRPPINVLIIPSPCNSDTDGVANDHQFPGNVDLLDFPIISLL